MQHCDRIYRYRERITLWLSPEMRALWNWLWTFDWQRNIIEIFICFLQVFVFVDLYTLWLLIFSFDPSMNFVLIYFRFHTKFMSLQHWSFLVCFACPFRIHALAHRKRANAIERLTSSLLFINDRQTQYIKLYWTNHCESIQAIFSFIFPTSASWMFLL